MKKRIFTLLLMLLLVFGLSVTASAADNDEFLIDNANLLTASEEARLASRLEEVSRAYGAQLIVVTVKNTGGRDIAYYIEDFYDDNQYGYGANRDGVMLLISMSTREYQVLCNGFADSAIEIDTIAEVFVPYLSAGEYALGFEVFANECEYYLNGYLNGFPFDVEGSLIVALIVGLIIGLIVAFVLKGQLNSVHRQNQADVYVKPGSMKLTQSRDFFLYRTVTRTPRPKSNSSGSRGGGSSRSTGGGRF